MNEFIDPRVPRALPPELADLKAFLVWKLVYKPGKPKPSKVPFYANGTPRAGDQGSESDRAQLVTFEAAKKACIARDYSGIGIAITADLGIVALDFDNVVDNGVIRPDVAALCQGTYTEFSPSGTGVRAFMRGNLPSKKDAHAEKGPFGVEFFGDSGFVTNTGNVTPDCAMWGYDAVVAPISDAVMALYVQRFGAPVSNALTARSENDNWLLSLGKKVGWTIEQARPIVMALDAGMSRDKWLKVGMGLSFEFDGSDEAYSLFDEWSATAESYGGEKDTAGRWRSFGRSASGNDITAAWILREYKDTAKKAAQAQDEKYREPSQFEAERREHQKAMNERIGAGADTVPVSERITGQTALRRFVFKSDGARVADIFNTHYDLSLPEWESTYAASKELVPQPDKVLKDGAKKPQPDREIPVSKLWLESPFRKTVVCGTFKAGGGLMLPDPNGRLALNTWRPYDRSVPPGDTVAAFLDHIAFLFPIASDRERFLDWLAHIEQRPGVLPHTAWLHIARNFGLGRNWLASVLARVWPGNVAANCDLVQLLRSGFNGQLSRKVLAVVDEIREGGRDSQWEHAEKMKSLITEEHRVINPKYGRQAIEFNACRWLMFSNHRSAIPMEAGDRRIEVVVTDATPQTGDYYARLYAALDDPGFIASVAAFLGDRDLSKFNPGRHAAMTAAKLAATKASQSPMVGWCELLQEHWPADVITSTNLYQVLEGDERVGSLNAAHRRTLEQFGIEAYGHLVKRRDGPVRVSIVRNTPKWKSASPAEIRAELDKAFCTSGRAYLEQLAADQSDDVQFADCDLF